MQISSFMWGRATALHASKVESGNHVYLSLCPPMWSSAVIYVASFCLIFMQVLCTRVVTIMSSS